MELTFNTVMLHTKASYSSNHINLVPTRFTAKLFAYHLSFATALPSLPLLGQGAGIFTTLNTSKPFSLSNNYRDTRASIISSLINEVYPQD